VGRAFSGNRLKIPLAETGAKHRLAFMQACQVAKECQRWCEKGVGGGRVPGTEAPPASQPAAAVGCVCPSPSALVAGTAAKSAHGADSKSTALRRRVQ
jgi:hypothetical protein